MMFQDPFGTVARLDINRMRDYQQFLSFYEGKQWRSQEEASARRERRLTYNYAKTIVGKMTAYVMGDIDFAVEPRKNTDDEAPAKKAEEYLYKTAEANGLNLLDFASEMDAAVLGDGAYKVTWNSQEEQVQITAPDVQGIWAWRSIQNPRRLRRVAQRYEADIDEAREIPGLERITVSQGKVTILEDWTAERFVLYAKGDGLTAAAFRDEPNPYALIPYILYPNVQRPKHQWGESDIPGIQEVCEEINRELSILSRIMELSGAPVTVLENVEKPEGIRVTPGALWVLPEASRAYLLDLLSSGGIKVHLDYVTALYRVLHDIGESPRTAFGGTDRDLSGVALEVELQPLIQRVKRKRLVRNEMFNDRARMTLALSDKFGGTSFGKDLQVRVIWGGITPRDRNALVDQEGRLVQWGIHSRRRASDELGIEDSEVELARWLDEEALIAQGARTSAPFLPGQE